jgi:large subunit ribosomal protein L33
LESTEKFSFFVIVSDHRFNLGECGNSLPYVIARVVPQFVPPLAGLQSRELRDLTIQYFSGIKFYHRRKTMAERTISVLQCTQCKNKNYYFTSKKKKELKIELNKYCKKCKKHTLHKFVKG